MSEPRSVRLILVHLSCIVLIHNVSLLLVGSDGLHSENLESGIVVCADPFLFNSAGQSLSGFQILHCTADVFLVALLLGWILRRRTCCLVGVELFTFVHNCLHLLSYCKCESGICVWIGVYLSSVASSPPSSRSETVKSELTCTWWFCRVCGHHSTCILLVLSDREVPCTVLW